MNKNFQHSY